jgi:pimeloyl-ACP methyl ester carboxylesterase
VRLANHVEFVKVFLETHNLQDVVLVGHSYSGIVVGQVASMNEQRVHRTVFIEGFLPVNGQSLLDVSGLDVAHEKSLIDENDGLWPAPTREELDGQPHLSSDLIDLLATKQRDHPGKTVTDTVQMLRPLTLLRASFISEPGWLGSSREADLVETLQSCEGWDFHIVKGGHWPMLTIPDELTALLHGVST